MKVYATFLCLTVGLAVGCAVRKPPLRAYQVTRADQLIGGPSAKGKIGDFIIENDQIRALIGNVGPGWAAGVFGGTLLDVDRHRWWSGEREGRGWDAFSEAFPLANLLVVDPLNPTRAVRLPKPGEEGPIKVETTVSFIGIPEGKDGQDGEAIVRVQGHSAYMFDMLKFLNRDLLEGYLKDLSVYGFSFDQIADMVEQFLGVNIFALLNRLQISFDFTTDYILHEGESFLTMRTTITLAPQSEALLNGCTPVPCDKACEHGYVFEEVSEPREGFSSPYKRMCPVCECAPAPKQMPTFNESRDFFKILLGGLADWKDPTWRGGVVAGDFLFYGTEASVFVPGEGYDIDRRIFEDMWQGIGSLGSPYVYDFVAATAKNVSYAWTTVNPREKPEYECLSFRVALVRLDDPKREQEVARALEEKYGIGDAQARIRQLMVQGKPVFLFEVESGVQDPGEQAGEEARLKAVADWKTRFLEQDPRVAQARQDLGAGAVIGLVAAHECLPSKVAIPLFSTSATAVLTHFSEGDRLENKDGRIFDYNRTYVYERYLVVGDGDVGSVLRSVYPLRGVKTGEVSGVVVEEGSLEPLSHVSVFAMQDPLEILEREGLNKPRECEGALDTYEALRRCSVKVTSSAGLVSQMETDVGQDLDLDGVFSGPLPEGRYFLFAHTLERGTSRPVKVQVKAGKVDWVVLTLPRTGTIEYRVMDQSGLSIPAKIAFIPVDHTGMKYDWEGLNDPALRDPRFEHGIMKLEHSATGKGVVSLPPGLYKIIASRGIEYSVATVDRFEVKPGQSQVLELVLVHEVDTSEYVSGDFHVHARNSVDSALPLEVRVAAAVAEGLETFSSSDHDHVTYYWPYVLEMGLKQFLLTMVGVETSPLEWGHFNAYALDYDDRAVPVHNPVQWMKSTISKIWDDLRSRGLGPPEDVIIQVNHPRDGFMGYLGQIGMRPYDLERKTPGLEMCNKAIEEAPCSFDALEILNGKHAEYLHTPTVGEVHMYNRCYREIVMANDPEAFVMENGQTEGNVVCGWLQTAPYATCATMQPPTGTLLTEEQAEERIMWDHCLWHRQFREAMKRCKGADLLECKRVALEALKYLAARYMLERTFEEDLAFWSTSEETDVGCDINKALKGCTAIQEGGSYAAGCGGCACETCVCTLHPECCQTQSQGGTGWNEACAQACRSECYGCEIRPCTSRFQPIEDWFALLNAGLRVTGVANSDSHNTVDEIGLPRNFIRVGTDRVEGLGIFDITRSIKNEMVVMSSGPMIDFAIITDDGRRAQIGETLNAKGANSIGAWIRVQTPSWFNVDRVEIYRNGRLYRRLFPQAEKAAIVDFQGTLDLGLQENDAWFVVTAYGLNDEEQLSPVYKRHPYGHLLTQQVIALGAEQLLASYKPDLKTLYDDPMLQPVLKNLLKIESVDELLALVSGALASLAIQLPDSYPVIPWAMTNPVWVDVDGNGFVPPNAKDEDGDGAWDLPPFCSRPCDPQAPACGKNQVCVERSGDGAFTCQIPAPPTCPE